MTSYDKEEIPFFIKCIAFIFQLIFIYILWNYGGSLYKITLFIIWYIFWYIIGLITDDR